MTHDPSASSLSPEHQALDRLLGECPDQRAAMMLSQLDGYLAGLLVSPRRFSEERAMSLRLREEIQEMLWRGLTGRRRWLTGPLAMFLFCSYAKSDRG
jgi:hypothetical protein